MEDQIDYIIYSDGFPTTIHNQEHVKKLVEIAKTQGTWGEGMSRMYNGRGSINSLTYFGLNVTNDDPSYLLLDANKYYRGSTDKLLEKPFIGPDQIVFDKSLERIKAEKYDKAIEELAPLAEKHPKQIAVCYWLARAHAANGDIEGARNWLIRSIQAGWSYQQFTRQDAFFSKALENDVFLELVERIPNEEWGSLATQPFRTRNAWANNGSINGAPDEGSHYFLSTVLAVTRNKGTSEQDALAQLERTAKADGTRPKGTFYFASTGDIRSKTRQPRFADAVEHLKKLGHRAEIISTNTPKAGSAAGVMLGIATFDWSKSGCEILPGAICENLTSMGGILEKSGQTKLSEFLKYGAAGSSGTVVEPFAMQSKFPEPMIHVHYVKGASLAEAFYQSVSGPFQLLIVGDPLCRPWAVFPKFTINRPEGIVPVTGDVEWQIDNSKSPVPIAGFEMYLDGKLTGRRAEAPTIRFDSTKFTDGYHELRVVAVANHMLQNSSRIIIPIMVNNHGHILTLSTEKSKYVLTETVEFTPTWSGKSPVQLMHNGRIVGKTAAAQGKYAVPAKKLGRGPVQVFAIAATPDGQTIVSAPVSLDIDGKILTTIPDTEPKRNPNQNQGNSD